MTVEDAVIGVGTGTMLEALRRAAAVTPDKPALICYQSGSRHQIGYADLAAQVDRMAANLYRLGVRPGEVVVLQLPNCWQLQALCLACARIGAIPAPVMPILRRREVEFILRRTASRLYLAAATFRGFSYTALAEELAAAVPSLIHRLFVGGAAVGEPDLEDELLEHEPEQVDLDSLEAGPDDSAQVMFTSGTTGEPKGVLHTHRTLTAMNSAQAQVLHLTDDDVTAMGSPTTHQAGYTWNFVMPLLLGGTAVHVDRWDPEQMLDICQREKVSFFMGAPTFLTDLVAVQRTNPRDLRHLRAFATGSAPIPPVLVEGALQILGCRLYALWGMTENGCVTITRPEEPLLRAAESDGTPVPGMQVRIVHPDTGQPVAVGDVGLLQVRGASQCRGYYGRPDLYAASITADGWFDTGDLARDDGYGGIRIAGRVKDLILRGGENVPAVEVEAALLRHAAIRDAAVVGYPDPRLGERACAVVVADDHTLDLDELRRHLRDLGMATQYWPERLHLVPHLPRTPSGKIQKFLLRQQLAA